MNATQRDEIIKLIQEDCLLAEYYIDEYDNTCAIGKLALAVGINKEFLLSKNQKWIGVLSDVFAPIHIKFGLTRENQIHIQNLNDLESTPEKRRQVIIEYVNSLPLKEE